MSYCTLRLYITVNSPVKHFIIVFYAETAYFVPQNNFTNFNFELKTEKIVFYSIYEHVDGSCWWKKGHFLIVVVPLLLSLKSWRTYIRIWVSEHQNHSLYHSNRTLYASENNKRHWQFRLKNVGTRNFSLLSWGSFLIIHFLALPKPVTCLRPSVKNNETIETNKGLCPVPYTLTAEYYLFRSNRALGKSQTLFSMQTYTQTPYPYTTDTNTYTHFVILDFCVWQ